MGQTIIINYIVFILSTGLRFSKLLKRIKIATSRARRMHLSVINFFCSSMGDWYTFRGDNSVKIAFVPIWKGIFVPIWKGIQHEFTNSSSNSASRIYNFNFMHSRIQLHEFNFMNSRIQLHEFTNSTSRMHEFNFTNSRIQLHEFNHEFTNSTSRIHEFNFTNSTSRIQLLNSWSWIREAEFVKLNSWIRELEFMKLNS